MDPWFMWAVGLFEGEGCLRVARKMYKSTPHAYLVLQMGMADESVIRHFHEVIGEGKVYGPYRNRDNLPRWEWYLTRHAAAMALLDRMLPYLGARRQEQAKRVLAEIARARPA